MMQQSPIGVFDSGVGGTSIWKEIHSLLPNEDTIYLADSKNAPYGEKSPEEIVALSVKNTELLLAKGCKIIVVACNTATTNAIDYLRKTYNVPFIGIEPAIKPAALQSSTKKVGVLATRGTLSSSLFHSTSKLFAEGITVIERDGEGLVPLIEAGDLEAVQLKDLVKRYVLPMVEEGIDYLVLGCTHYPYLQPYLKEILPNYVEIIDSGAAVAKQTKVVLQSHDFLNHKEVKGTCVFYSNANAEVLKRFVDTHQQHIAVSYLDF